MFLQNGYFSVLTLFTSEYRQDCDMKLNDALLVFVSKCWGGWYNHTHSFRAVQTESWFEYPRFCAWNWEFGQLGVSVPQAGLMKS